MIGAIAGDIAGSRFERSVWEGDAFESACCIKTDFTDACNHLIGQQATSFELFHSHCFVSDDTLMLIAVMDWLNSGGSLRQFLRLHFRTARDPRLFGKFFRSWAARDDDSSCGSVGNGAAMRVAPVAVVAETLDAARKLARESAIVTHEVEHAVVGAEAIASAVFLARNGHSKEFLKSYISHQFGYDLEVNLDRHRNSNRFSSDCRDTVPIAIAAFLVSNSLEETLRRAISMGGDTDTIACMAGAIADGYWPIEANLSQQVLSMLDPRSVTILTEFQSRLA